MEAALKLAQIVKDCSSANKKGHEARYNYARKAMDIARQNLHAAVNGSNQEEFDAALQLFKIHNDAFINAAEKLFAARKAEQDDVVTVHQITNSVIPTNDSEENA